MIFGFFDGMTELVSSATSTVTKREEPTKSYSDAVSGTSTKRMIIHPQLAEATEQTERWKRKFLQSEDKLRKLQGEVDELVKREMGTQEKLGLAIADYDKLSDRYTALKANHSETTTFLQSTMDKYQQETETTKKQSKAYDEKERAYQRLLAEHSESVRELEGLRLAHQNMQSLLDIRSAELRDAQAYLSKTDRVSHADVQRMVESLNAQLFQLAALVTDSVSYAADRKYGDEVQPAYERVKDRIGEPAADLLLSISHADDPVWVQMALQAVMALSSSCVIDSWDVRFTPVRNRLLTKIHDKIYVGEPQAISARWRVLLRRYVKEFRFKGTVGIPRAAKDLLERMKSILVVAGALNVTDAASWEDTFRAKVTDILTESANIQKAIGEDVTSCDFQLICPIAAAPFASASMDDVDDCGRRRRGGSQDGKPVMFTTEIGLRKCEKLAGEGEKAGEMHTVTLIKAKVAFVPPPA